MIQKENRYSLWLRPLQTQTDDLTKIISRLAHRYRATAFPPHITLLPDTKKPLDTIKKTCKKISEQYRSFDIALHEIAYTEAYFRNLYILAATERPITELYEDTKNRLCYQKNETFLPHVSLLYGKLEIKQQQALKNELARSYNNIFSCKRLDIYNITGHESRWHLIESFALAKNYKEF